MMTVPTNPGLLVGDTFLAVAVGTLVWAKVSTWAMAAVRQMGFVD